MILPQRDRLVTFLLAHGTMHFSCANLTAEQTVPLARSNAFHHRQNGTESTPQHPLLQSNHLLVSSRPSPQLPQLLPITPSCGQQPLNSPVGPARHRSAIRRRGAVSKEPWHYHCIKLKLKIDYLANWAEQLWNAFLRHHGRYGAPTTMEEGVSIKRVSYLRRGVETKGKCLFSDILSFYFMK